jgi:RimJ/RimL family protein N-acetyltransferase
MKPILETERLYFRAFTINDAQLLIELNANPQVTRYTGDGPVKDLDDAKRILTEIIFPQYPNKLGRWAVHLKSNDEFIGWCGLKYIANEDEIDLGYRFFQSHWNNGYASESAKAVIDYAKVVLQLKRIVARAAKKNTASINVIKKLGMHYLQDELCAHDASEKYYLDLI